VNKQFRKFNAQAVPSRYRLSSGGMVEQGRRPAGAVHVERYLENLREQAKTDAEARLALDDFERRLRGIDRETELINADVHRAVESAIGLDYKTAGGELAGFDVRSDARDATGRRRLKNAYVVTVSRGGKPYPMIYFEDF
jgi:hypothetical protein